MIKDPELESSSLIEVSYPLPDSVVNLVRAENWKAIDDYFLEAERPKGALFEFLSTYINFSSIEHIIAIRQGPDDEDGIWHDDGSRILGFSLSLTEFPEEIEGGYLRFKPKGPGEYTSISTRPIGKILLFKTGIYGFEHMVTSVSKGRRIVLAGWCS